MAWSEAWSEGEEELDEFARGEAWQQRQQRHELRRRRLVRLRGRVGGRVSVRVGGMGVVVGWCGEEGGELCGPYGTRREGERIHRQDGCRLASNSTIPAGSGVRSGVACGPREGAGAAS